MNLSLRSRFLIARVALFAFFAIVTMLQLFSFPGQFAYMREQEGLSLLQEIVLTGLAAGFLLCAQFAIVGVWKVLGHMESESFFTASSLIWINRVVTALKVAIAPPVILFVIIAPQADDPGILVLLTAVTLFLITVFMLASLLRDQIETRSND